MQSDNNADNKKKNKYTWTEVWRILRLFVIQFLDADFTRLYTHFTLPILTYLTVRNYQRTRKLVHQTNLALTALWTYDQIHSHRWDRPLPRTPFSWVWCPKSNNVKQCKCCKWWVHTDLLVTKLKKKHAKQSRLPWWWRLCQQSHQRCIGREPTKNRVTEAIRGSHCTVVSRFVHIRIGVVSTLALHARVPFWRS